MEFNTIRIKGKGENREKVKQAITSSLAKEIGKLLDGYPLEEGVVTIKTTVFYSSISKDFKE